MKRIIWSLFCIIVITISCNKKLVTDTAHTQVSVDSVYTGYENKETDIEPKTEPKQTRLRFPGYTVVFHNFKGYDLSYSDDETLIYIFGGNNNNPYATLNFEERELEDYIETIIVKQDSVYINEDLDERINNTLIQIIPQDSKDRFKISMCFCRS